MSVNDEDKVLKNSIPIIDSSLLKKVSLVFKDEKAQLNIHLNKKGTKILADYTEINILKKIAIVIDDKVYSIPRIMDSIWNGTFLVDLEALTAQEIHDLALVLNSGVLPSIIRAETIYYIGSKGN
jgi:preprotein translocase subunit SecD